MGIAQLIGTIVLPIAMIAGAIAAWRMPKRERRDPNAPGWRDTSLDDWRQERDAAADAERESRHAAAPAERTGAERELDETRRQQRIGG